MTARGMLEGDVKIALCCMLAACGRYDFTTVYPDAPDVPDAVRLPGNFDYTDFTDCSSLVLRGSASCIAGELEITPASAILEGFAWRGQTYDSTMVQSFAMQLRVHLTASLASNGGDGIAIIFQSDPRGFDAAGNPGGSLGLDGITPSAAIELDTFGNDFDPSSNHVGLDIDGDPISVVTADPPFVMLATSIFSVWIDYRATDHALAVSIDPSTTKPGTPLLTTTTDLSRFGTAAYLGIVGSTGVQYQENHVVSWSLAVY